MINVLVTGAGGGVGQGIIKSLKMIEGIEIKIIAADMDSLATGLYFADCAYLVPSVTSPIYLERLEEIFTQESVNYYFPGTDVELRFCAKNKNLIAEKYGVHVVVSPLLSVEIADDKYKTYEFLRRSGFNYPETFLGSDVGMSKVQYPVIVKPMIGCRSIGVSIVYNQEQLQSRLIKEQNLIVQELIGMDGDEYTCTVVMVNGSASEVMILNRTLRAGDTYKAKPVRSKIISEYVKKVAMALNIEGSCNFQLRLDSAGVPKIFEINCRFSGTTPFLSLLGFNPVECYLKKVMGLPHESEINYNASILRYWNEVVVDNAVIETLGAKLSIAPKVIKHALL